MVSPEHFELSKEDLIEQLRKENEWFKKKYGPYIKTRGIHNWKNLFKKPNLYEWTILFMIILSLFMGWAYSKDIDACQEYINSYQFQNPNLNPQTNIQPLNISWFNNSAMLNEETNKSKET